MNPAFGRLQLFTQKHTQPSTVLLIYVHLPDEDMVFCPPIFPVSVDRLFSGVQRRVGAPTSAKMLSLEGCMRSTWVGRPGACNLHHESEYDDEFHFALEKSGF